jgi:hypothetical protein
LTDCTQTPTHRPRARLPLLVAVSLTILVTASGLLAGSARADGDPASDVLAGQQLFLPQDAGIPATQQAQLGALLSAAQRDGVQLRVALIASRTDLGSITELWRQPQSYARFLAQELSLLYRGPLLVVMPNGYGVSRLASPLGAGRSALAGVGAPGPNLAAATITAIQRLAAASGHNLPLPAATAPSAPGSSSTVSWIVFALGAVVIVMAWTASLRARPLRADAQAVGRDG